MAAKKYARLSRGEIAFNYLNMLILTLFTLSIVLPVLMVVLNSLRSAKDIAGKTFTLIPESISLDAYTFLLGNSTKIRDGFVSSVILTVGGTALCLLFTGTMAYPLSKRYLPGRTGVMTMVLITMFFSGGLVPSYLLIISMGLKDTLWALILPSLIGSWNMILMRNFYFQIPDSIEESAKIEGANDIVIFLKMYIPLSLPSIATIGLFYAVGFWNSWFSASIYLNTQSKYPLQLVLKGIMATATVSQLAESSYVPGQVVLTDENIKAAAIVITTVPIILVYPFIQKYFVRGVYVGSIKG